MSDEATAPDPERARLARTITEPSSLEAVAEAVSVATETQRTVYVERLAAGWRWGFVHTGGPYPLLRVTALFLQMSHYNLVVACRELKGTGLSLVCRDIENPEAPLEWALLEFDGPTPEREVADRIRKAVGG